MMLNQMLNDVESNVESWNPPLSTFHNARMDIAVAMAQPYSSTLHTSLIADAALIYDSRRQFFSRIFHMYRSFYTWKYIL